MIITQLMALGIIGVRSPEGRHRTTIPNIGAVDVLLCHQDHIGSTSGYAVGLVVDAVVCLGLL